MSVLPLSNNFSAGVNGNSILAADTGSGNKWDTVTIGASCTCTYDNTHVRNTEAMKITTPATSAATHVDWTGLGSLTSNMYFRAYIYRTANPPGGLNWHFQKLWTGASASCAFMSISPTGLVRPQNAAAGNIGDGVVAIALNQFFRLEWRVLPSTTTGEFEWRLYNSPDSDSITDSKLITGAVLGANIDQMYWGTAVGGDPANDTYWVGGVDASAAGWFGSGNVSRILHAGTSKRFGPY